MLSILFSFSFSLIYAKNNVNMYSELIGYDLIQFPVTINISNTTINTYNANITSSNSNFEVKDMLDCDFFFYNIISYSLAK